jgi:hypothetical protein
MPASEQTIKQLYAVMRKHLNCRQLNALLIDLARVAGNQSFRETMFRLKSWHQTQKLVDHRAESED